MVIILSNVIKVKTNYMFIYLNARTSCTLQGTKQPFVCFPFHVPDIQAGSSWTQFLIHVASGGMAGARLSPFETATSLDASVLSIIFLPMTFYLLDILKPGPCNQSPDQDSGDNFPSVCSTLWELGSALPFSEEMNCGHNEINYSSLFLPEEGERLKMLFEFCVMSDLFIYRISFQASNFSVC